MSFKHRIFFIFLECPLICLVSSSIITSFCFSSFSMPFTILYKVIRSLLSLLSCRVGSPISFNLSFYMRSFSSSTILVLSLWILSNFLISFSCSWSGRHTACLLHISAVLFLLYSYNLKLCPSLQFLFPSLLSNLPSAPMFLCAEDG